MNSAYRILTAQTSVSKIFLEQFQTFGDLNRYPSRRVITVVYYALVNTESFDIQPGVTVSDAQWFNVKEIPSMAFDHKEILDKCLTFLKHKIQHEPIGFNLLPQKFTLLQLQELYEAILGKELDKPNFRRKFLKMNLLILGNEVQTNVSHRAAKLYHFDKAVYDKLVEKGFSFEI
ncbi:MAG: NUDIX hydrolase [Pedobacter sp.]|nr:NUDIX hydrolase [Pedobacter sp.]